MIVLIFIVFFSILIVNHFYKIFFCEKLIEGIVGNSGGDNESCESTDMKIGKLMSQVNINTNDISSLKNQMVAVNASINSMDNNKRQQKEVSNASGKDINNPQPVPTV